MIMLRISRWVIILEYVVLLNAIFMRGRFDTVKEGGDMKM
jgi:hypothetical protein